MAKQHRRGAPRKSAPKRGAPLKSASESPRRGAPLKSEFQPAAEPLTHEDMLTLTPYDKVQPKRATFVWNPYLPVGELCTLDGPEGVGKSTITWDLIARITSGRPLPGELGKRKPANVIYMSSENDPAKVVRPRLEAFGADLSRVHQTGKVMTTLGERTLYLNRVDVLGKAIVEVRPALIVVDPLEAFLTGLEAVSTRATMDALAALVARYETTLLAIRHIAADGRKVTGSTRVSFAVRSSLRIVGCFCPSGAGCPVLVHSKSNQTKAGPSWGYLIKDHGLEWVTNQYTWADVERMTRERARSQPRRTEAGDFLLSFLRDGPRRASEVEHASQVAGFSESTIKRAKDALGILSYQRAREWYWVLGETREHAGDSEATDAEYAEDSDDVTVIPTGEDVASAEAEVRASLVSARRARDVQH